MTPDDEAQFIALWQAGVTQAAIAQALGVPLGTVKSRAHHLVAQGKLQARPRGGAYPHVRARERQEMPAPGPPSAPATGGGPEDVHVHEPRVEAAALQALLAGQQALQDELAHQRAALDTLRAEVEALRLAPPSPPEPGGCIRPRRRPRDAVARSETREPCTVRLRPSLWEAAMEAAATLGQPHNHFVEDALRAHLRQVGAATGPAP
jgi:hypothetical protein